MSVDFLGYVSGLAREGQWEGADLLEFCDGHFSLLFHVEPTDFFLSFDIGWADFLKLSYSTVTDFCEISV